jgi:hypothetical protein
MICIGYGEYENKCTNEAGTKWSPYWCSRCNDLRMKRIGEQINTIMSKVFKENAPK